MPNLLLIMRKRGNLRVLSEALENEGHCCIGVDSTEVLEHALRQSSTPDMALMDVGGFGEAAWLMCEKLQQHQVPFIVLSASPELQLSSKTLSYGATSILQKPVVKASLLQLVNDITQPESE